MLDQDTTFEHSLIFICRHFLYGSSYIVHTKYSFFLQNVWTQAVQVLYLHQIQLGAITIIPLHTEARLAAVSGAVPDHSYCGYCPGTEQNPQKCCNILHIQLLI